MIKIYESQVWPTADKAPASFSKNRRGVGSHLKEPQKVRVLRTFFAGGIGSILAPGPITQKNNLAPDVRKKLPKLSILK